MSDKLYNRPLEHKEYIKLKYLSSNDSQKDEKRKKKKLMKNAVKTKKIKIFDDDIDLRHIEKNESDDELYYGTKEEKPVVAQVVDERPLHMRSSDIDKNRWKSVGDNIEEGVNTDKSNKNIVTKSESTVKRISKRNQHSLGIKNSKNTSLRHDSDSDLSPKRDQNRRDDRKSHSSKSIRHDSGSDLSPPRSISVPNSSSNRRRHDSDSDLSPPRDLKDNTLSKRSSVSNNTYKHDEDLSPPRYRSKNLANISKSSGKDSDSDLSPPRSERNHNESNIKSNDAKRSELTLAGKRSGLSDAKELRKELIAVKVKEKKMFESISDEVLGKNAKTVFRDSKSGKIRDLEEEARIQLQKDSIKEKINAEKKAKYDKWAKGLVQKAQQEERVVTDLHEMTKPLARYENDEDLDKHLREREREDDPMLATIRMNKSKKDLNEGKSVRPTYKGPTPALNRFNIMPGYRWDGVDRSNGFEKRYFDRINNREATVEEAYRWSTQDM